jgi:hypothetical protein
MSAGCAFRIGHDSPRKNVRTQRKKFTIRATAGLAAASAAPRGDGEHSARLAGCAKRQLRPAFEYARTHPNDPDVAEVAERVNKAKAAYLRWGRDTIGWAIYMFRSHAAA